MNIDLSPFRHLYPFQSNYIDIGGLKYHYLDEGSGDPVVMVHGNPTWSFYFRSLVSGLSGQFRTIVPDHMGCGLSDKPGLAEYDYRLENRVDDLEALIDSLELNRKISLIVHDWGGMIGMAYTLRHPERIGRLIITNTAAFPPPGGKAIPLRLRVIRNLRMFATPAVLGLNLFARGALYMAPYRRLSKDVKAGLIAPYNSWENRMATLKFVQDIPLAKGDPGFDIVQHSGDNLHRLTSIPMMICWGKHDFVFDIKYLSEWRRRFPDAQVHLFDHAGHYLLEDVPNEVLTLCIEFFNKNPI